MFATFEIERRQQPHWRFRRHHSPDFRRVLTPHVAQKHLTRKQARAFSRGGCTGERDCLPLYIFVSSLGAGVSAPYATAKSEQRSIVRERSHEDCGQFHGMRLAAMFAV